jgi:spore coat polysaccharide biosynthesis protein SpsF
MSGVTAIIQARMGSTRLPGKVLMKLAGRAVIDHVIEHVGAAREIGLIVVATTTEAADDVLVDHLSRTDVKVFRGSDADVLSRFEGAARFAGAETIVRVTADDPLKDPDVIDRVVSAFGDANPKCDYVSNTHPPTWPEGQDAEVISVAALFRAAAETRDPYDREHVTPYFYRNPDKFRCRNIERSPDLSACRLTLDTPDDFAFFEAVFAALDKKGNLIRLPEILDLLDVRPDIAAINVSAERSAAYR